MSDTTARVKQVLLKKIKGYSEEALTPEASFTKDLGLDSLDIVECIVAIEKEFDIKMDENEEDYIGTVGNLIEVVIIKLRKK